VARLRRFEGGGPGGPASRFHGALGEGTSLLLLFWSFQMKKLISLLVASVAVLSSGAAFADGEAAMNKAGCMACHAKDKKLVGPSFKDIAAKYKGQDAAAKLFDKVRKGGSGSFGPVPMSPNGPEKIADPELKDAIAVILKS
jgi:cytochrome c